MRSKIFIYLIFVFHSTILISQSLLVSTSNFIDSHEIEYIEFADIRYTDFADTLRISIDSSTVDFYFRLKIKKRLYYCNLEPIIFDIRTCQKLRLSFIKYKSHQYGCNMLVCTGEDRTWMLESCRIRKDSCCRNH